MTEISDKFAALGGAQGLLGVPTSEERPTSDGRGRFREFQRGSIYWTPQTGAHEIHGSIRAKWQALGAERMLGYPTTDESATPDGVGRFNHFERGSLYWRPHFGAFEVHGAIREKWKELGWERSPLGYPISDEAVASDGFGRISRFERGTISWSPRTGARESLTEEPGTTASNLSLMIHRVRCVDETGKPTWNNPVAEVGSDEIYLGGLTVDAAGSVRKVPFFKVGNFDDGGTKAYAPAHPFASFNLNDGQHLPKAYLTALMLVERDRGGSDTYLDRLVTETRSSVDEKMRRAPATPRSGPGSAAVLSPAVIEVIKSVAVEVAKQLATAAWNAVEDSLNDDVFTPQSILQEINSATPTFSGGRRESEVRVLTIKGHNAEYRIDLTWKIT